MHGTGESLKKADLKGISIFPRLYFIKLALLVIVLGITCSWSLASGSTDIGFAEIKDLMFNRSKLSEETFFILFNLRLVRLVLGILVGLSLALSGMILQGIFRNPLVDPFIIGISGGASLGAGIAILFGLNFTFLGINSVPIMAFITAVMAMAFAYSLSMVNKRVYIDRLLLGGIAISSLTSALLSLLLVLRGQDANAVIFWIMGSLAGRSWENIWAIIPYIIFVNIFAVMNLQKLNILQLGEESATNLGLNIDKIKIILILVSSLLAAAIVSVSGVIGFVGLIVPQIAKLFIKSTDFRLLYPIVMLLGAIILVCADTVARIVLIPQEIPVGIFTAMLGVPFFLFLLKNTTKIQN
jgi:iron complex transport system permease protein